MRGRRTVGRALRTLRRCLAAPHPIILMYHRVASLADDPWDLAVTAENFDGQLQLLKRQRQIVPLGWLATRMREGKPTRRMAAISFDDGYVDVLNEAKPLLERHDCPATVFMPTGFIGGTGGFWWDALTRAFLSTPALPGELTLTIAGTPYRWPILPRDADGGATRRRAHDEVWALLLPMPELEREKHLGLVLDWAGLERQAPPDARCMTEAEVRRLHVPGLIDIGAHTISHPSLPGLSADEQLREIGESVSVLHELTGVKPEGLAYPYGHHDGATVAAAAASGLAFACTTEGRPVTRSSPPLQLPRLQVPNVSPARFAREVLVHG